MSALKKALWKAGERAYSLNCLPDKHQDLSLIPRAHMKKCQELWALKSQCWGVRESWVPMVHWPVSLLIELQAYLLKYMFIGPENDNAVLWSPNA